MDQGKGVFWNGFQFKRRRWFQRIESVEEKDVVLVQDSGQCLREITESFPILVMKEDSGSFHGATCG
jgi:hypothetical protein